MVARWRENLLRRCAPPAGRRKVVGLVLRRAALGGVVRGKDQCVSGNPDARDRLGIEDQYRS